MTPIGQRHQRTYMTPNSAQVFAARNLDLLAAIENTIDALDSDTQLLQAIATAYAEIKSHLESVQEQIDVSRRIDAVLAKASDVCVRIYRDAQQRHLAARTDPELTTDDGVEDAYTSFIAAVSELHETIEALKEWIADHDAVLEPSTGAVFSNTDDLFAAILPAK